MTQEQQDKLLPLLLAVAMDGGNNSKEDLQEAVKKFLATLPAEDIARAASMRVEF